MIKVKLNQHCTCTDNTTSKVFIFRELILTTWNKTLMIKTLNGWPSTREDLCLQLHTRDTVFMKATFALNTLVRNMLFSNILSLFAKKLLFYSTRNNG